MTTLQERIATAIYENHPVDGTGWTVATAEELAITVMDVLNEPNILDPGGNLRHTAENRMERIVDSMTDLFDAHPEHLDTDKCVVFISTESHGGLVAHGYGEDPGDKSMVTAAIVDVMMHLQAMFRSIGKDLELIPIPDNPGYLDEMQ